MGTRMLAAGVVCLQMAAASEWAPEEVAAASKRLTQASRLLAIAFWTRAAVGALPHRAPCARCTAESTCTIACVWLHRFGEEHLATSRAREALAVLQLHAQQRQAVESVIR